MFCNVFKSLIDGKSLVLLVVTFSDKPIPVARILI